MQEIIFYDSLIEMPIVPSVININNTPFLKNCEPTSMFLPYFVDDKM